MLTNRHNWSQEKILLNQNLETFNLQIPSDAQFFLKQEFNYIHPHISLKRKYNFIDNNVVKMMIFNYSNDINQKMKQKNLFPIEENQIAVRFRSSSLCLQMLIFYLKTMCGEEQYILDQFSELINLEDQLIFFILLNICIDWQYHGLTFATLPPQVEDNGKTKLGEFNTALRKISLSTKGSFIHESAHACTFFTFRPKNPFSFATQPHDQEKNYLGDLGNPAQLKFRQCVREDKAGLKQSGIVDYLFSREIDHSRKDEDFSARVSMLQSQLLNFFTHIEVCYHPDIFNKKSLAEIFPYYINIRAELLALAKEYQISKRAALAVLARCLPRLHDYFETDLKRILKHRLKFFVDTYHPHINDKTDFLAENKAYALMYQADIMQLIRLHEDDEATTLLGKLKAV